MFIRLTTFLFSISCALSQFNYKLSGGYYDQAGNTDYKYYNGGFSVTAYGDFSVGGIMVKDSELLLSVDKISQHTQVKTMKMIKTFYFYLIFGPTVSFPHLSLLKNLMIRTVV